MNKTDIAVEIMKANLTGADIVELMDLLRLKHGQTAAKAKRAFAIGDEVEFAAGIHGIIRGKVEKIAIKFVKVRAADGLRWSVSAASLKKV